MAPSWKKMWQSVAVFICVVCFASAKDRTKPIQLQEDNWYDILEGEWLVEFYAPWCPACKQLAPIWESVATWSQDLDISVAQVDVTTNPGLSGRFLVMALPTIIHVKDGVFRTYRGSREENSFISFIDDGIWEAVEPIPWYKSPNTPHMAALGYFFKAAMHVREVHTAMTEEYGIPVWGSYGIFALLTIFVGLLLGLVLVCMCDYMFPPAPQQMPSKYSAIHREIPANIDDIRDNDGDILDDRQDPVGAESSPTTADGPRKRVPHSDE